MTYIIPYHRKKWNVILDPGFQSYKTTVQHEQSNVQGGILHTIIDYKSIEIPLGIKHNLFLNNNSKIYLSAAYIFDFMFNSTFESKRNNGSLWESYEFIRKNNLVFAAGFTYNKYTLELRYNTSKQDLINRNTFDSQFNSFSINLGYTIF